MFGSPNFDFYNRLIFFNQELGQLLQDMCLAKIVCTFNESTSLKTCGFRFTADFI